MFVFLISGKSVSKNIGFLAEARLKLQDLNDIRKSGRYPIYRINGLKEAVKKIYHEAGRSVADIGFENGKRISLSSEQESQQHWNHDYVTTAHAAQVMAAISMQKALDETLYARRHFM